MMFTHLLYSHTYRNRLWDLIFKPGAHRTQAGAPGFLKLFLCGRLYVCLCVCVSIPEAINNLWCDMDPI